MPLSYSTQLRSQISDLLYGPELCEQLSQWLATKPEFET